MLKIKIARESSGPGSQDSSWGKILWERVRREDITADSLDDFVQKIIARAREISKENNILIVRIEGRWEKIIDSEKVLATIYYSQETPLLKKKKLEKEHRDLLKRLEEIEQKL